jgi:DNA-directed RNA polymerase specialized sigma24 family protein
LHRIEHSLSVSAIGSVSEDQAMVDDAAYGLMLWDGESKGTLNSVINMIRQSKPVVVYLAPKRTFQNLHSANDVMDLLGTATARVCDALSANLAFNTCRNVRRKYFGGLTVEEVAEVLQVSPETVARDWRLARAWLLRELAKAPAIDE